MDKLFTILQGDNLQHLENLCETRAGSVALIYIDPPFNTGKRQSRTRIKTTRVEKDGGDRIGFGGRAYKTEKIDENSYEDNFSDFGAFLYPRLKVAHRLLAPNGSLFFHIDWREAARCRLLLEEIFGGPEHCINEIIWAYDYGARSKRRWPTKHDNIYWFAKNPSDYIYNYDEIDRVPYMAPELVSPEKAIRGKTPTDVWWLTTKLLAGLSTDGEKGPSDVWRHTIVPTNGHEKTGYPTQKPLGIVERIVRIHSHPGDVVLDFFAGSGTAGEAALRYGRRAILIDESEEAVRVMEKRLGNVAKKGGEIGEWENLKRSLFDIFARIPSSGTKHKQARTIVAECLRRKGIGDLKMEGRQIVVKKRKVAIKFSTLWKGGIYTFQQIRKNDEFDILFCLGVSPGDAHAWVFAKDKIKWDELRHQHGGEAGQDTWWTSFPPSNCPHKWMEPKDGNLEKACDELRLLL